MLIVAERELFGLLHKINIAYNVFFFFQFLCLMAGTLVLLLTPPSGIYVFIIFGQTIATIIFGIIVSNLTNKYLTKKYPEAKVNVSIFAGLTGFRISGNLDGPLLQQAKLNNDKLAVTIIRKKILLFIFCGAVVVGLAVLASIVLT